MCLNSAQSVCPKNVVRARLFGSRGLLVGLWMSIVRHGMKEDHTIPCSSARLTAEYSNAREVIPAYSHEDRHQATTNGPPQVLPTQHKKLKNLAHAFLTSSRSTKERSHQKWGIKDQPRRRGPPPFAPFWAAHLRLHLVRLGASGHGNAGTSGNLAWREEIMMTCHRLNLQGLRKHKKEI